MIKLKHILSLALALGLMGCDTTTQRQHYLHPSKRRAVTVEKNTPQYFKYLAETQQGEAKQYYQLKAVERYIALDKLHKASTLLKKIDDEELTDALRTQKYLSKATIALAEERSDDCLTNLGKINDIEDAAVSAKQAYFELAAKANEMMEYYAKGVAARMVLDLLLNEKESIANNNLLIWQDLQNLSGADIRKMEESDISLKVRAWLTLSYIVKTTEDEALLLKRLSYWQGQYPSHPANQLLPKDVPHIAFTPKAQHIVALLPLHGRLGTSGNAIRNGILTAYYDSHLQHQVDIDFIDTSNGKIGELYQKAIDKSADFIIGPLSKENVLRLARSTSLPVPTLALNQVALDHTPKNLYQFGLSSQEEATIVAKQAFSDQQHHALIIVPDTDWGKTIASTMENTWLAEGGDVFDTLYVDKKQNLSDQISKLLQVNDSKWRGKKIQQIIGRKALFTPRRRQDVDVLLVALSPQEARQIKPLLSFFYGENIPVYGTSRLYTGVTSGQFDRDMAGIFFCDMPWVLSSSGRYVKTKKQLQKLWPNDFKQNIRLYALGVDSLELSQDFNHLILFPKFGIEGASGTLTLDPYGVVHRQLQWAVMQRNGKPKAINLT